MTDQLIKALYHIRDEHSAFTQDSGDQVCIVCADAALMAPLAFPCHTRCDVNRILQLLGVQIGLDD